MANGEGSTKGTGWITFSGILLIVAGAVSLLDALWAFRYDDTIVALILFEDNLTVWGVVWLVVGIILFAAGFGVFSHAQWARWTGIIAASIAVLSNLSWAQAQPQESLIGAILAVLVIYGLAAYGGDPDARAEQPSF